MKKLACTLAALAFGSRKARPNDVCRAKNQSSIGPGGRVRHASAETFIELSCHRGKREATYRVDLADNRCLCVTKASRHPPPHLLASVVLFVQIVSSICPMCMDLINPRNVSTEQSWQKM